MITLEEARLRQTAFHEQGTRLIDALHLRELLKPLGEVHIDGSYAYQLMVKGDIDVHIFNDDLNFSAVAKIAKTFLDFNGLMRLKVLDTTVNKPKPGEPLGYYVGPKILFEEVPWTIDIWMTNTAVKSDGKTFPLGWHQALNETQREAILLIKFQLKEQGRYGVPSDKTYNSADVYRAVLTDGVSNLDELDAWRPTHPFTGGLS